MAYSANWMTKQKKLSTANGTAKALSCAVAMTMAAMLTHSTKTPSAMLMEAHVMTKGTSAIDAGSLQRTKHSLSGTSFLVHDVSHLAKMKSH